MSLCDLRPYGTSSASLVARVHLERIYNDIGAERNRNRGACYRDQAPDLWLQ